MKKMKDFKLTVWNAELKRFQIGIIRFSNDCTGLYLVKRYDF